MADARHIGRLARTGGLLAATALVALALAAWAADHPAGLAVGADGTVYVSEPDRVARFTAAGAPLGSFAATHPRGIAVAADGSLWVAVDGGVAHVTAAGAPIT